MLLKHCDDADQRDLLLAQKESSLRLLKTLTDMIVLSDQHSIKQKMSLVHLSTNMAIQTCYDMYLHMAKLKKIDFDLQLAEVDSKIFVDRELFLTSLGAIVNNALKNTKEGGVQVATKNHKMDGMVTISITDSGDGIDTKDFGSIFKDLNEKKVACTKNMRLQESVSVLHGGTLNQWGDR